MDLLRLRYMDTLRPKSIGTRSRAAALERLRQIELIELSLDLDFDSLVSYADSVAEERQELTKFVLDEASNYHQGSTYQVGAASTAQK